jgi:hypothetical protein
MVPSASLSTVMLILASRLCQSCHERVDRVLVLLPGEAAEGQEVEHTAKDLGSRGATATTSGCIPAVAVPMHSPRGEDTIADWLHPFTMSHTARTISFTAIGRNGTMDVAELETAELMPRRAVATASGAPSSPQIEMKRGAIRDR